MFRAFSFTGAHWGIFFKNTFKIIGLSLLLLPIGSWAGSYSARVEVQAFIDKMAAEHQFDKKQLQALFDQVTPQPQVIAAYQKPAERSVSYKRYQKMFVNAKRINLGVQFWRDHQPLLAKASAVYGVPEAVMVAIIGVESRFGSHKGKNKVLDSLTTLAFDREERQAFFQKELGEFLLLCREQNFDPTTITGSYAGAMGVPQFIASSYRHYAVDFDADGKVDLFTSHADVIGSVGNYFARHGWQPGALVLTPVARDKYRAFKIMANSTSSDIKVDSSSNISHMASDDELMALATGRSRSGLKPERELLAFQHLGVYPQAAIANEPLALLYFDDEAKGEYMFGHQNFYVITRYNQSSMYARAVWELAQAISAQYHKAQHE